ncbi:autotransporter assembly complex protein TamA [Celeribacter sp.]|uniref:autotransporter assembly complex protein TamA n=1 Tax=Celeribacter sp. TaxID=1890673 RepID=UPI003A94397B
MDNLRNVLLVGACLAFANAASAFELRVDAGADTAITEAVKSASAVATAKSANVTATDEIIAAVQADYRNILGALYRKGYYGSTISIKVDGREGAALSLISLPKTVNSVAISVDPGPRFSFGKTKVSPLATGTEMPAEFTRGAPALAPLVGEAKDAAISAWRDNAHAKAALKDQSIVANHPKRELDVALAIDPGPRATFGELEVKGETTVSARRIRKIAGLPEGRDFSPEYVDLAARRLQRTGAFRSVTLREADTLNTDNSLDITATIVDEKPHRYGFGAEFSSLEGASLSAYWMDRNFTRNADRLRFDAEIAGLGGDTGVDYTLSASYRRPTSFHPKYTGLLNAEIARLNEPDYQSDTGEFTFGVEVEASLLSDVSFSLGYRYSDVTDTLGSRQFHHLIFPIEGTRDNRDNRLDPKSGTYLDADIMPFIGLRGSASGGRVFADVRRYFTFGTDDRFTLAGRAQVGSVIGASIAETPPDLLFFSGGGGTVRGQPYHSLGVPSGGDTTGGTSFLGLSGELRAGITDKIGLVGFYDIGAIGDDALPASGADWHSGAGLGLRYNTGFGPIRVDIAAPVTGDTGSGIQLYVGIGQAF